MLQDYLRCIGFSEYCERRLASILIRELFRHETRTQKTCLIGENDYYSETRIEVAKGIGLCICGGYSIDGDEKSTTDIYQYYPFNERNSLSSALNGEIHERSDKYAHLCIIVDKRNEALMVFRLENNTEYIRRVRDQFPIAIKRTYLTGYCLEGKVILGIQRKRDAKRTNHPNRDDQNPLRNHENPSSLSKYNEREANSWEKIDFAAKRKFKYNIYNYIDTLFSPTSMEPEIYTVLGNIRNVELLENHFSKERFYNLKLDVNHIHLHVVIHSEDLEGEPEIGHRFKGKICLFGRIELEDIG